MSLLLQTLFGRLPIGWLQLTQSRARFAAALAGVAFANVLVFVQLGIMNSMATATLKPYGFFQADIMISAGDANALTPALPQIDGGVRIASGSSDGRAFAVYRFDADGLHTLRVAGSGAGAYTLRLFVVGDLNTQSFMEAWNSEAFQTVRAAHLRKDVRGTVCEKCVAYA
jgi:hypothetical protein